MEDQKLHFTTILHEVRDAWGLSNEEYMLVDIIYHLSNHPEENRPEKKGWCYATKKTLSKIVSCSDAALIYHITDLLFMGLIERKQLSKRESYLRTTTLWYEGAIQKNCTQLQKLKRPEKLSTQKLGTQALVPKNWVLSTQKLGTLSAQKLVTDIYKEIYIRDKDNSVPNGTKNSEIIVSRENSAQDILDNVSKNNIPPALDKKEKVVLINFRDKEEPQAVKKQKPTPLTPVELVVYEAYHKLIYNLSKPTDPLVLKGIPLIIKMFKEKEDIIGGPAEKKVCEAFEKFRRHERYMHLIQRSGWSVSPKAVFTESFIANELISLFFNQPPYGGTSTTSPLSDADVRKSEEDTEENIRKFMANNPGRIIAP